MHNEILAAVPRLVQGLLAAIGIAALALACGRADAELHSGRGIVRDVLVEDRQVVIEHDDIPDLMPAMTMNFEVADPALLAQLAPGQIIDFALRHHLKGVLVSGARVGEIAGRVKAAGLGVALPAHRPGANARCGESADPPLAIPRWRSAWSDSSTRSRSPR